jgi:hypothetical protein
MPVWIALRQNRRRKSGEQQNSGFDHICSPDIICLWHVN